PVPQPTSGPRPHRAGPRGHDGLPAGPLSTLRRLARRIIGTPAIVLLALVAALALPLVAALQAISVLGHLVGRPPRWRALRVAAFAALYTAGECVALAACALLWAAAPVQRRRDPVAWRERHVRLLGRLLRVFLRAAQTVFGFRLHLEA